MLAWVVIDRTYSRQFLPKSSSPRTLCLCVEFSDSFRPTSVVPTTYALHPATAAPQPLCNQSVTHSFYLDGGCIPPVALPSRQRSSRMPIPVPYILYFSISCALFALFALPKNSTLLFSSDSALCVKKHNHRGVGKGVRQRSTSSCGVLANSARPKLPTPLSAPRHASHESPITNHFLSEPFHLHPVTGVLESEWNPMTPDKSPKTLYQRIWDSHVVREDPGQPSIIYIDRHLVHEGTSPQAFAGLRAEGRQVRRPDLTFAVMDHSVSTTDRTLLILDNDAKLQFDALEKNCRESGVRLFDMNSKNQGIVHIIGPELGITQPGQTLVCGDSHTSTHGAFGTLAFGIGTSEVEHVLATQCLVQSRSKTLHILVHGKRPKGVTAKDLILAIIGKTGIAGGNGHVAEYGGEAIRALSMDGRMTVCNMTIECGARAGMIAPDETTFAYLEGR